MATKKVKNTPTTKSKVASTVHTNGKKPRTNTISQEPIDLDEFQSKIEVRNVTMADYADLIKLQSECFPGMAVWSREQIESQLTVFPEGQFCIEYDGDIVGSCSSLIIDFEEYDSTANWSDISEKGFITNHDPEGDTLYGIEIMVSPQFRGMKLARRLYEARKQLARDMNLRRIVIGGRIPGYDQYRDSMTAREYVEKVMNLTMTDPVLTTQLSNGFVLKRLIPNYLSSDSESDGFATLLEWANIDYVPGGVKRHLYARQVRLSLVQYQLRPIKDFKDFAKQCEYFIDVASGYKSDFVVFPEMFTMQLLSFVNAKSPARAVRKLASYTPHYVELFSELAIKYNINVVGGSHFTLDGELLNNVAYLFLRNGEIRQQYKLHITPNERHWWGVQPGDSVNVFQTDRGKVAILICYDIEFPELCRIAVEKGAEIIFVPFC
ncbi:MAG: GNAT family N-acetyltransferase, partial [Bdellovibrionales bacterium]|nr:GNAT family N-acetyltransferase [Bdellovibrionales bacterium]